METKIYQNIPLDMREKMLEDMATRTEARPVKKHFSPDELTEYRKQYFDNALLQKKALEELKKAQEVYQAAIKMPVKENLYLQNNIRTGYVEVEQQVYLFDEQNEGMMYVYDNQGELMESRRLLPEERQTKIKQHNPVLD